MAHGLDVKPEHGYYVLVVPLDGDLTKVEIADQTPDGGLTPNNRRTFTAGRAVKTEFMPTKMEWRDPHGHSIPDFDSGNFLNVSERAKALIERIEPGVHQFIPIDYHDMKGRLLERRYIFVVCNRIDSLDRERTTMVLARGILWVLASDLEPDELPPGFDASRPAKMVFNNTQIGGAHLWQDKHLLGGSGAFISDAFAHAVIAAGLTGVRVSPAESV
jgi:hypothetical protein